ncbi:hypothetical protein FE391_30105 [Nonomuraea sp. KC401]|uniref:hypothetical protein n=1 Tax=unclassified Nonomuraea TaxID=2593643 RepID=UPI0010FDAC73|nr:MULTISPECIES: hypothetical protein [unclassified Nonomuraea]NBE97382.1 hypothetical protein [Nonomuraea sp. K271]TLF62411.1 hypothetical protein FE391_30105 [Nonomuraea sp. KC401]
MSVGLTFHRGALETCATAARSASGAFAGSAGQAPDVTAFGNVSGSAAMATAAGDLLRAAEQAAKTLGGRLEAVERTLDAVERTVVAADGAAVQR